MTYSGGFCLITALSSDFSTSWGKVGEAETAQDGGQGTGGFAGGLSARGDVVRLGVPGVGLIAESSGSCFTDTGQQLPRNTGPEQRGRPVKLMC